MLGPGRARAAARVICLGPAAIDVRARERDPQGPGPDALARAICPGSVAIDARDRERDPQGPGPGPVARAPLTRPLAVLPAACRDPGRHARAPPRARRL